MAQARGARQSAGAIATLPQLAWQEPTEQWPGAFPSYGGAYGDEWGDWGRIGVQPPPPEVVGLLSPEVNEELLNEIIQQAILLRGRNDDPAFIAEHLMARYPGLNPEIWNDFIEAWLAYDLAGGAGEGVGESTAAAATKPAGAEGRTRGRTGSTGSTHWNPWMNPWVSMAEGGVVTEPTVTVLAEEGPEAVVPLTPRTSSAYTPPTPSPGTGGFRDVGSPAPKIRKTTTQTSTGTSASDAIADQIAALQQQRNNEINALLAQASQMVGEMHAVDERKSIALGSGRARKMGVEVDRIYSEVQKLSNQIDITSNNYSNQIIAAGRRLDKALADEQAARNAQAAEDAATADQEYQDWWENVNAPGVYDVGAVGETPDVVPSTPLERAPMPEMFILNMEDGRFLRYALNPDGSSYVIVQQGGPWTEYWSYFDENWNSIKMYTQNELSTAWAAAYGG